MIHHGDCLEVLRTLPDNSVDAVVTDPPYGLSFMGKRWDYDVPSVEVWAECLRVLKPGGHLLAFAGTRTQHRMAVRIEDAGFEIRDMIAWVYGSGFPKSLDVSKAIDRMDATEEQEARRLRFTAWVRSTGLTARQIDDATGTNMGGHYTTAASQPAIMTREHLEAVRHMVAEVPEWVERECDIRSVESRNMAEREVVGQTKHKPGIANGTKGHTTVGGTYAQRIPITAPATEAARQWQGWGTALKPALEPITVARKPLEGTVAENVLTWGTGGVNVDWCRVKGMAPVTVQGQSARAGEVYGADQLDQRVFEPHASGRWPANLIHDGSDEVVGLFPSARSAGNYPSDATGRDGVTSFGGGQGQLYADTGSAARFFYCAKASKRDRDEGLEDMQKDGVRVTNTGHTGNPSAQNGERTFIPRANHHPTVKPTALMRYLCRLVTPPGGVVLDPFTGSGSTGKAAKLEGFSFIGIEREAEYVAIARARIGMPDHPMPAALAPPEATPQLTLF